MRSPLALALAVTLFLFAPPASQAQTNSTWNGSTGNWTDASRWSTNPIFPNNGQPNAGDTYNAIVSSGTVTLDQNIIIQGLSFSGGFINGNSNLTLNASSTLSGGFLVGSGTTTLNGALSLNSVGIFSIGRDVVNNGPTTWTGNNFINNSTGAWVNQSGAVFDIQNNQIWFASAAFTNAAGATLLKSAGTGTSTLSRDVNNSGSVAVNSGTLALGSGSSSGSGTFSVAAGATLSLGSYTLAAGTTISGAGGLNITGSTTINGTSTATGPVSVSGTASFNTSTNFSSLTLSGVLTGSGNISVSGATNWSGQMTGSGSTTFNGAVALTTPLGINRNVINNGTTTWTGNNFINNSTGAWANQSGAVFDIQNNQTWFSNAVFTNAAGATLRKSAGTGTSTLQVAVTNAGIVQAQSGTLAFNGGYTQTAGSTVLAGGALSSNSVMSFNGGDLTGAGTIAASVAFTNASLTPGSSAGTLTFNGNLDLGAGSVLNYELGATSDLVIVNGNLTLDGTLNATTLSGFDQGTFVLIDYSGSLTDHGLDLGTLPGGFSYQVLNDAANTQIDLVVAAVGVPEPATWLMIGSASILGGGTGFTCWRRKRRRRGVGRNGLALATGSSVAERCDSTLPRVPRSRSGRRRTHRTPAL